jgi:hypothetical protein
MTTNLPADDVFTENATAYGYSPNLWLRCRPIPLATINVTAGGNLFRVDHKPGHYTDAYTAGVTGMQTVADSGFVDSSRSMICGLWREDYGTERAIEADFNILYQGGSTPTDGVLGDYHQSVGLWARVNGGTISGAGTRDEFHQDVNGYFFCQSYRTSTSHRYILMRCVAGVLTVIDDLEMTRTYDAGDNVQGEFAPRKLRMEVTGTGATVNIKVIRHAQGSDETIIDFDDTNAARIVAAGRCGLSLHMPGPYAASSSSAPSCLYVKIDDMTVPAVPVELMTDHFGSSRLDRGGYRLTPTDNLSNQGRSMMCGWTGDTQGQDDSTRIHHSQLLSDVDNVGVGDVLPASNAWGWYLSARENPSPVAAQHRSVSVTMQTDSGTAREVGLVGRFLPTGVPFTDYSADSDTDKAAYVVVILYSAAGAFTAELRSYRPGVAHVVMATAAAADPALATITFGVAFTLDFEIQTVDNARIVMRAKIGSTAIIFTPAVSGVSLSGEWIFDDRTVTFKNFVGGEGLFFDTAGGAALAHYVIFDTWTDVALSNVSGLAGTPDNLWPSVEMQSETFGLVGTLEIDHSWPVQEEGRFLQNREILRSGAMTVFPRTRVNRRTWRIQADAITSTQRAALLEFYRAHQGPEQPFNWVTPSGEAVFAKFEGDELAHALLAPGTETVFFVLIEVFADPAQGTFPDVGWDPTSPDNPEASGDVYWKIHREDSHVNETYTIRLSQPAPVGGTTVNYLLGGDAIESTDYSVAAGASPLTIPAGSSTATVTINFLGNTSWHHERLLTLTITPTGSSQINSITEGEEQLRIYIQPDSLMPTGTVTPPIINFDSASSTYSGPGSGGPHDVPVTITPDTGGTDEDVLAYYTVGGTATEGVDYRFSRPLLGDELVDVSAGNTGDLKLAVTGAGAGSGNTVIITLDYEASAGGDMNLHNNTHLNTFEHPAGYLGLHAATGHGEYPFPADSGPHTDGPAAALTAGAAKGLRPLTLFTDPLHTHPDTGGLLTGGYATSQAPAAGFLETSRENEIFCDGPDVLLQFDDYQRFSINVVPPSAGSGLARSRYIRVELYNENTGSEFAVHFDSESTTGGFMPSAVTDSFGLSWGVNSFGEHYGSEGGANNDFGVDVSVSGVTRLWFVYHEPNGTRHATDSHRHTRRIWPSPWSLARYNESGSRMGGNLGGTNAANHWNEGWIFYDPMVERSGTILSGAPGQHWPRHGHFWRPRGNCLQGVTTVTHTVTL